MPSSRVSFRISWVTLSYLAKYSMTRRSIVWRAVSMRQLSYTPFHSTCTNSTITSNPSIFFVKKLIQTVGVSKPLDGAKILPKSTILWVRSLRCNNVTDRRQTDGSCGRATRRTWRNNVCLKILGLIISRTIEFRHHDSWYLTFTNHWYDFIWSIIFQHGHSPPRFKLPRSLSPHYYKDKRYLGYFTEGALVTW